MHRLLPLIVLAAEIGVTASLAGAATATTRGSSGETPLPPRVPVTFRSLLAEMVDRDAVARFPDPAYRCLQASSYNRESVHRDQPGWFADSDGLGFIRVERTDHGSEWVILEHEGPGCLTKMWTPAFYYDLAERTGPNLRVYLDGDATPLIDESFIRLVEGRGSIGPPFAARTARAGNVYLPIPFARRCKVTLTAKPFYHLINYRAYPDGTPVESLTRETWQGAAPVQDATGRQLYSPPAPADPGIRSLRAYVPPGRRAKMDLPSGPSAVRHLTIRLPAATTQPSVLRSTVLVLSFDGRETVWCPLGDFFSSPDALHPFQTWERTVYGDGTLVCRWVMPYRSSAAVHLLNRGRETIEVEWAAAVGPWSWDERSLHFHARWRPDDVAPGTPFQDWNFVDIRGRGVYVGDTWTVLNIQSNTWWGEGDEKIYVDEAWDRGFPTHFGTGTEDYYGWAGGEVPTRNDEFDEPFVANVRVGGLDGRTLGFNLCTRTRSLDAIPFERRLRFDMESSFGVDIREPWNLLGYSAATFWYARPGATHNRPAARKDAERPIRSVPELRALSEAIRSGARPPITPEPRRRQAP